MRKQKKLTGPEWIRLKKAVESWEKEDMAFHSTDYLKELSQKVEAGPPTYSPRTPKQNEYYQAYSYVKEWINTWERFQAFDDLKGRGTWHKWQLKKYKNQNLSKIDFRNPQLHKYQVAHFKIGERYGNDIEYLVLTRAGENEDQIKIIYSFDLNTFCQECGCLIKGFHKKRVEWVCPKCGLVIPSFTNVNERATNDQWKFTSKPPKNYRKNWKKASKNYKKTIGMLKKDARRGHHQINKDEQSMTVTKGFIKHELNLKEYQINEIVSLINKLNYNKLYGNRSKTVDETIKTVCICLYVLEKMGNPKRIGRNKFLLDLGLTNDIYKVISGRIDSQLSD